MQHFNNRGGLTLIEVVVALGLLGIIAVTLFPAFLIANQVTMASKEMTDANYQVQQEIELFYDHIVIEENGDMPSALIALGYHQVNTQWFKEFDLNGEPFRYQITYTQDVQTPDYGTVLFIIAHETEPNTWSERARIEHFQRIQP